MSGDRQVIEPVAVHVPQSGQPSPADVLDMLADERRDGIGQVRIHRPTGCLPEQQMGFTAPISSVVAGCADQHIVQAISVHIPGTGHGIAGEVDLQLAAPGPVCPVQRDAGRPTTRPPEDQVDLPRLHPELAVVRSTDEEVSKPIPVQVPSHRYRVPSRVVRTLAEEAGVSVSQ